MKRNDLVVLLLRYVYKDDEFLNFKHNCSGNQLPQQHPHSSKKPALFSATRYNEAVHKLIGTGSSFLNPGSS